MHVPSKVSENKNLVTFFRCPWPLIICGRGCIRRKVSTFESQNQIIRWSQISKITAPWLLPLALAFTKVIARHSRNFSLNRVLLAFLTVLALSLMTYITKSAFPKVPLRRPPRIVAKNQRWNQLCCYIARSRFYRPWACRESGDYGIFVLQITARMCRDA